MGETVSLTLIFIYLIMSFITYKNGPYVTDQAARPSLDPIQIERRLDELDRHIVRVEALRPYEVLAESSPAVTVLQAAIRETLVSCFGENTASYRHFQAAGYLYVDAESPGFFNRNAAQNSHREARNNIDRTLGLLREAQEVLRGDLAEARKRFDRAAQTDLRPAPLSRRVFVVHGHDDGAREAVARFLEKIGFEPIILHEQANRGGTVIEKIEANRDVGFAVVLLTPDDVGRSIKEDELKSRARQNVLLELGYFIGHLGRGRVCALKRGDVELPSDYVGVVWEKMDDGGGWKQALGRELDAAGHEIDWNRVMRS
jgi:predicted nucleotide-binding protein